MRLFLPLFEARGENRSPTCTRIGLHTCNLACLGIRQDLVMPRYNCAVLPFMRY